jgi:hypothetical protein
MKNFKVNLILITLIILTAFYNAKADIPTGKVSIQNQIFTAANTLEFDIYLLDDIGEGAGKSVFQYFMGQYVIDFNPDIANNGELSYAIIDSDLPEAFVPLNPAVWENQLRLGTNSIPPSNEMPVISSTAPGTKIVRMRLKTTAKAFSNVPPDLKIRSGPDNPYTKVCTFEDKRITEVIIDKGENGNITEVEDNISIPTEFSLKQNYPNPFNPETQISFDIPVSSYVTMKVYDVVGNEVKTLVSEDRPAGSYNIIFNGSGFSSGIYFYKIAADGFSSVKKMVLIK